MRGTVEGFIDDVIAGDNGKACAATTDKRSCLATLLLAQEFLGDDGYEAVLGDGWRQSLGEATVTFTDDAHASMPPLPSDDEPTELVRQEGRWLIVFEGGL